MDAQFDAQQHSNKIEEQLQEALQETEVGVLSACRLQDLDYTVLPHTLISDVSFGTMQIYLSSKCTLPVQTAADLLSRLQREKENLHDRMAAIHQQLCDQAGMAEAEKLALLR